ncbi:MAG: hypothetical protein O2888_03945 [Chloroflexi bacterium]|nr:hypothetical protein [Chloroflexota bacterium]MQC17415.1 hypothetical protein [Chloroflexota bacterium]
MPDAPETTSPAPSLDDIAAALGLAPHEVQTFDPAHPKFDAQRPLLVLQPQMEAARPLVRRRYRPDTLARVLHNAVADATVATLPLDAHAWLMPALAPEEDRRSLEGLRGVMEHLFGPDGCPWDREQTHETLRTFLIEETYELVDAIDRGDMPGLREEVGDLLAHMFMQTTLAQLSGAFTLEDVLEYANEKFVRRHPHVFGPDAGSGEEASTTDALLGQWERIKAEERAERGDAEDAPHEGALDSTPAAAPSLQRAQALLRRARRAGLADPPATARELLTAALAREDWAAALWSVALLAGDAEVDAEETLRQASAAFTRSFRELEAEARAAGIDVSDLPSERRALPWSAVSPAISPSA